MRAGGTLLRRCDAKPLDLLGLMELLDPPKVLVSTSSLAAFMHARLSLLHLNADTMLWTTQDGEGQSYA